MHVRAGFRAVVQQPAVVLGEIAWRWAFGAAAWVLVILVLRRILAHVDVTQAERLIARGSDVFLIADAGARILVQVLPQLARDSLVLAPAIAILWIAAATLGRGITLRALLSRDAGEQVAEGLHLGRLAVLNLLRAVFTLATLIAYLGGLLLVGATLSPQNPAAAVLVGLLLASVIGLSWSLVNWVLALAPIWIVRDGRPALKSIADSVEFYHRTRASYVGIAWWFGLLRTAAMLAALVAAVLSTRATPAAAVAMCVVITLVYFALADFLYLARLAAYIASDASSQLPAIGSQPIIPAPQPLSSPAKPLSSPAP